MKIDRNKVWLKYNKHCSYCGKEITYKDMQIDHLTPKKFAHYYEHENMKTFIGAKGDNIDAFENLMPSCRRCNHYKRGYRLDEFRGLLKTIHQRIAKDYITKVGIDYGVVNFKPFDGVFYFEEFMSKGDLGYGK